MARRCDVFLSLSLVACSEYGLSKPDRVQTAEDPADTTPPDDVPDPLDTAAALDTGTGPPPAEAAMYAHSSTLLYEVDAATLSVQLIGRFQAPNGFDVSGMVDIAIDLQGRMYGGTSNRLYRIDPTDATATEVCTMSLASTALTFTSTGELFAASWDQIVRVDTATCATTHLVSNSAYLTSGDLVGLPDGWLYWAVNGSGSDEIVRVHPSSAAIEWIGPAGGDRLYGLGYELGQLYGFSETGWIVSIDPATGSGAPLLDAGVAWWGATTNPVVW